jgi:hypothetical protein
MGGDAAPRPEREIGAPSRESAAETCSVRFIGPADVVHLFRAVLCTVRRRTERDMGRLPTEGEALGAMLDHALSSWGALDTKVPARHRVFDRDGWRCAALHVDAEPARDGLTWQMGIRPGTPPLVAYRSGDLQVTAVPS